MISSETVKKALLMVNNGDTPCSLSSNKGYIEAVFENSGRLYILSFNV